MKRHVAQFSRHFVWWFVVVLFVPLILGFGSLHMPSDEIRSLGVEILWAIRSVPEHVIGPQPIVLALLFYAGVCLTLAIMTVVLANSALLTDPSARYAVRSARQNANVRHPDRGA